MNKKRINQIILLVALVLLLLMPSLTSARPEYAVKESRNCPYCHTRDGPPQLNEIGVYYATHNYSMEGYVPTPIATPTPEPEKEIEIGVHMTTWDVGLRGLALILLVLAIVYVIRL
ncbi:MAG: hypothetical protein MPEBLZ_00818 [Candidatus Methanoperedens nitroreducens]|uniref:Uncharacterized protein n=1 Tax=Candidatus Methanoperedens nitratireducens TaxID=1392998 RepID=A0A0P8ACQ6_9EURY|nr:hypothetical protein [Candidatus Methanoperedens sp. BLZ2]KAB2944644.1 MAG: hypothetical protein F9K14_13410 [Candidatus Methanoperedens sp.]KPQ44591.1 MAG: hypothetical protein MPEBLZ_00818 [Candidatus Methanoperedens sp. BLZ1]MBZ0175935.1 hypothetical protein [Candidatus Methanoperedens nitroreducens]CAG0954953.1 hypothetical protein METP2_00443 [Methanosarcinales archaeon]MCX9076447.1 hypothetical protein [Candidatus Methanoperedens sp.]